MNALPQPVSIFHSFAFLLLGCFLCFAPARAQEQAIRIDPSVIGGESIELPEHMRERLSVYSTVQITGTETILESRPGQLAVHFGSILPDTVEALPGAVALERFEVRSRGAQLVAGTEYGDEAVAVRFAAYKGSLGERGWVNLNVTPRGIRGLIQWNASTYIVEPARTDGSQAPQGGHLLYAVSDLELEPGWCETDTRALPNDLRQLMASLDDLPARKTGDPELLTVELALEAPYELYLEYGSDVEAATAAMLATVASASLIFEQDVDLTLDVVFARVWATEGDPYTPPPPGESLSVLLHSFRDYWNQHMKHVERDLALMITVPAQGGIAVLDQLCNDFGSYAVSSEFADVVAHEIGHVIGSPHTHNCGWPAGPEGILAPIDKCAVAEGGCIVNVVEHTDGSIMSYCARENLYFHELPSNFMRAVAELRSCTGAGTMTFNTVSGRVTLNGGGLGGVTIRALGTPGNVEATTESDGTYSLELANERYSLSADREGYLVRPAGYSTIFTTVYVAGVDVSEVNFVAAELVADSYEPDDDAASASEIPTDGSVQERTIHTPLNDDYVRFDAEAGQTYYITIDRGGPDGLSTGLFSIDLIDTDGATILAAATQFPPALIEWEAPSSGVYYVLISGAKKFYQLSVATQLQTVSVAQQLPAFLFSSSDWGDYDNDGDLDIIATGLDEETFDINMALLGNEEGVLVDQEVAFTLCDGSCGAQTDAEFIDYDNDGDLDILHALRGDVRIHVNNNSTYSDTLVAIEEPFRIVSASGGDYDNDGDVDILVALTGGIEAQPGLHVLRKDEDGYFEIDLKIQGIDTGKVLWSDYDVDGDLDIVLVGRDLPGSHDPPPSAVTKIFRNEEGAFSEVELGIEPVEGDPDISFADFDSDGDLDLAISGMTRPNVGPRATVTRVYSNTNGAYTLHADLLGHRDSSVDWGDFDNDGDLDLVIAGFLSALVPATTLYINEDGDFIPWPLNFQLPPSGGSATWGDYNNDWDLDLSLIGGNSYLVSNEALVQNTAPGPPSGLSVVVEQEAQESATFSWLPAQDEGTPVLGLTYNLRVGKTQGGVDVVSPLSDPLTGQRRVARPGNVGPLTQWVLKGLEPGQTYYWSVQAIDNGFAGSAWAPEASFVAGEPTDTEGGNGLPRVYALHQNYPNPFSDETVIRYDLPEAAYVKLDVVNVIGQVVATLVDGEQTAGSHRAMWDAADYPSGLYVYRIQTGEYSSSKKFVVLK